MNINRIFSMLLFLVVSGCASVTVIPSPSATQKGIRFYQPQPYLLVTQSPNGTTQDKIIWLPNMKKEYAIQIHGGLGSSDIKLTLQDGWNLTSYGDKRDSKIPEIVGSLTGNVRKLTSQKHTTEAQSVAPSSLPSGLYKIDFDLNSGMICHIRPVPVSAP